MTVKPVRRLIPAVALSERQRMEERTHQVQQEAKARLAGSLPNISIEEEEQNEYQSSL
jgi:hypothetical protein